jgi:hypothetical protein
MRGFLQNPFQQREQFGTFTLGASFTLGENTYG